mgnify:CR=1 FL=1
MNKKTAKIKVTVTREEVKELEISFPYYTKDGAYYCKFLSKDTAMWVVDFPFKKQIEYSIYGIPDSWITKDTITEEEFNTKFNEVINSLIEINNEKAI